MKPLKKATLEKEHVTSLSANKNIKIKYHHRARAHLYVNPSHSYTRRVQILENRMHFKRSLDYVTNLLKSSAVRLTAKTLFKSSYST